MTVTCLANQKKIRVIVNPIKNTGQGTTGQVTRRRAHPEDRRPDPSPRRRSTAACKVPAGPTSGMTTTATGCDFSFISDTGLAAGSVDQDAVQFQTKPQQMTTCPPGDMSYVATAPNSDGTAGSARHRGRRLGGKPNS